MASRTPLRYPMPYPISQADRAQHKKRSQKIIAWVAINIPNIPRTRNRSVTTARMASRFPPDAGGVVTNLQRRLTASKAGESGRSRAEGT